MHPPVRKGFARLLPPLLLLVALGGTVMFLSPALAERLLFVPSRDDPGPPPALGGTEGELLTLSTADGVRIRGWWYDVRRAGAPQVLFLHGNAGHVGYWAPLAEELVSQGVSVLLLEYRGYGGSEGRPTEEGLHADALAGYAYLVDRAGGGGGVVVFGSSMGGAVAARLAASAPVAGLILESAFTSLVEMARTLYPFVPSFLFRRLEGRFVTVDRVREVTAPLLVVHGTRDEIVPLRMGLELFERANEPKDWLGIPGAGHNDVLWVGGHAYVQRLGAFAWKCAGGGLPR